MYETAQVNKVNTSMSIRTEGRSIQIGTYGRYTCTYKENNMEEKSDDLHVNTSG